MHQHIDKIKIQVIKVADDSNEIRSNKIEQYSTPNCLIPMVVLMHQIKNIWQPPKVAALHFDGELKFLLGNTPNGY